MTDITPTTAVLELSRLSRQLDEAGFRIKGAEMDAVRKRYVYTVAFARAFLASSGSNAQARTHQATLDTEQERLDAELAEAELRILKSDIRVLENRMDAGRSVVGVLRAEASVVGR
jgi:hypothetical protein